MFKTIAANKNKHLIAVVMMVVFIGVFPVTRAYAQDDVSYDDGSYDSGLDYGSSDYSDYDSGSYDSGLDYGSTDYGSEYDNGSYDSGLDYGSNDYSGGNYYDDTADNGTYYDDTTGNGTYYDDTSDCGSTCGTYYDDTADNGTYYDDTTGDGTYYDDTTDCGSSCGGTYYDDTADGTPCPVSCSDYTEQNGVLYSNNEDETQQDETQQEETQQEEFQQEETMQPYTVTAPQYQTVFGSSPIAPIHYASTPIIAPAPVYHTPVPTPVYPQPKPQPVPQPTPVQPSIKTITNTCTYGSCNSTNTNTYTYTDNSINNSGNTTVTGSYNTAIVTPVAQTPVQYPVQYVFPQPQPTPVYPIQNVACSITAIPSHAAYNQPVTLSWSAQGATTAVLSNGIGQVAPNGSLIARPASSVQYVLTVWGPNGQTSTCNVVVTISGSQVSLTQIPYTGFDFGPFGDALYWLGLLAFAGAAGYLMVYYKGGAMTLATSMVGNRKASYIAPAISSTTKVAFAPVAIATPVAAPVTVQSGRVTTDSMHVAHQHGEMPRIMITRN